MKYKPLEGLVRVGFGYKPEFQDMAACFCWESSEGCARHSNLPQMIDTLRRLRVGPYQIDNMGTEEPFFTNSLSESQNKALIHGLSRPIVLVIKLPRGENKKNEFLIDAGIISKGYSLRQVPEVLNYLQCKPEDLRFLRKTDRNYVLLEDKYKYHILASLE